VKRIDLEYKAIVCKGILNFEREVELSIRDGWKVQAGISGFSVGKKVWLAQAMVRRKVPAWLKVRKVIPKT